MLVGLYLTITFFHANVNSTFLNSICYPLAYKKTIDFHIIILYPTDLLYLISSRRFLLLILWNFLDNHAICNQRLHSFFLSICIPFTSLSCLMILLKTFRTTLNRSGEVVENMLSLFPVRRTPLQISSY